MEFLCTSLITTAFAHVVIRIAPLNILLATILDTADL